MLVFQEIEIQTSSNFAVRSGTRPNNFRTGFLDHSSMLPYLQLVRFPNLLVVALTQSLIFYRLILPAFERNGIDAQLSHLQFALLVIACAIVTAAGYVINDILDTKADAVNKPGRNHVDDLGLANCRWLFVVLILIGYGISLQLALSLGKSHLIWLYPVAVGLLSLYSRYVKPIPLAGNLLVATFCAGVPALVALAELEGLNSLVISEPATIRILFIYGIFAFVATWLRELVKDMEDINGDRLIGRRTIPIILGISNSRSLGILLSLLNLFALLAPLLLGWPAFRKPGILICVVLLCLALCYFAWQLLRSRNARDYGRISTQLKLFLLGGLGLLVLV
ncbi:hypothetical protein CEQ90_07925 [Lewinellaceae bacterium SD302]|nr:hypothetical protein CEQ90_07925 [Lewinellaceae bacterium SD302]